MPSPRSHTGVSIGFAVFAATLKPCAKGCPRLTEQFLLHAGNSAIAVGVLVVLLAILNEVRSGAAAVVPRLVLRTVEARRAASVLVAGLVALLASHLVELYGDFVNTPSGEAAHEVVETISLVLLLAAHVWFWRIVRVKVDPSKVVRLPGSPQ